MKEQIQTLRDMLDHFYCPAEDEALDKLETYLADLQSERDQLAARVRELHRCEVGLEDPDAMLAHLRAMQPEELKAINAIFTGRR